MCIFLQLITSQEMFRTIFFILWCFPTTSYLACSLTAYSLTLYIHPFDSSLSKDTSHTVKTQEHAPSLMYSTNTLACIACYCSRHEGPCLSLKHVNWSGGYVSSQLCDQSYNECTVRSYDNCLQLCNKQNYGAIDQEYKNKMIRCMIQKRNSFVHWEGWFFL